jgi:glucosyl-dolichyl phosphate glucuronosyltransferase
LTAAMSCSVVVCTASHRRAHLVVACIESLLAGTRPPDEVILVVDQNPSLKAELSSRLPGCVRVLQTARPGLSEARNVGLRESTSAVVAFVDDDATVESGWLDSTLRALEGDTGTVGVGGAVLPRWGAPRRWLCDELLWIVGCTHRGHREDAGPIRNPIGCNMAFRRDVLCAVGGFATQFGKRGNALETCDETELALRIERSYGSGRIRFAPAARVRHFVPPDRISCRLLLRRSLSEGLSKGRIHRMYRRPALAPERDYVRRLVLEAVPRMLLGGIGKRDRELVAGAGAVLLSLLVTGGAFAVGAAAAELRSRPRHERQQVGARGRELEYGAAATPVWITTRDGGGGARDRNRRSEAGDVTNSDFRPGRVRDGSLR